MFITRIPFETVDWKEIENERHEGETGFANWKVRQCGDIRVRMVEYSPGYKADHWCKKGHIILCLDGDLTTELQDGRVIELKKGMSYHVEDENFPHRSHTINGARLFIVD